MNQEQLAAAVHVQSQTLGRVLTRLEAGGLVTRKRDPHDRRQFQVAITEAGEAALRAAREAESAAVAAEFDGWEILREQLFPLCELLPGTPTSTWFDPQLMCRGPYRCGARISPGPTTSASQRPVFFRRLSKKDDSRRRLPLP